MFLLEAWDSNELLRLESLQVDIEPPLGTQVHPSNLMTVTHFGHFFPLYPPLDSINSTLQAQVHPWMVSTCSYLAQIHPTIVPT